VAATYQPLERLTGTRLALEGFTPPTTPVIYASNSSQKYDFLSFRSAMWARGVPIATITKAKNYHVAWMRPVMENTGVIPLASKGYVILRDVTDTVGATTHGGRVPRAARPPRRGRAAPRRTALSRPARHAAARARRLLRPARGEPA
jgi:hypothetical protein